ncbi:zinc finger protein 787-like [Ischnura elegans]|uniref:zinc finger protein 787-like n=1 Tax=Ischnura elegans TaxID=197161 RepID=UPI001ED89457|nr:zinc finger protein 787-like [Ischnura elegans]
MSRFHVYVLSLPQLDVAGGRMLASEAEPGARAALYLRAYPLGASPPSSSRSPLPHHHSQRPRLQPPHLSVHPHARSSWPSAASTAIPPQQHRNSSSLVPQSPDASGLAVCTDCGRGYSCRSTLVRHRRYECGVQPRFRCPICSRRFTHNFNLAAHMWVVHQKMTSGSVKPEERP